MSPMPTLALARPAGMEMRDEARPVAGWTLLDARTVDANAVMTSMLARRRWVLGFPDQALATAAGCLETVRGRGCAVSLCFVLATAAIPIAVWTGRRDLAAERAAALSALAERCGSGICRDWARCHALALSWNAEEDTAATLDGLGPVELEYLATMGVDAAVTRLAERIDNGAAAWCLPELLRLRAEACIRNGSEEAGLAQLEAALELAERTSAKSWALRAGTDVARILAAAGQRDAVYVLLKPLFDGFTEGAGTADLEHAALLLQKLTWCRPSGYGSRQMIAR